jgi:hypothetical protein
MSLLLIPVAAAEPTAGRRAVHARWIRLPVAATTTYNLIEASSRSPPAGGVVHRAARPRLGRRGCLGVVCGLVNTSNNLSNLST